MIRSDFLIGGNCGLNLISMEKKYYIFIGTIDITKRKKRNFCFIQRDENPLKANNKLDEWLKAQYTGDFDMEIKSVTMLN